MTDPNVFVGLEIADHEVRMIVGQFFNTRLNVLKLERVPISALAFHNIIDQTALVERLKQTAQHITATLGVDIKRVVLALPSVDMHRYVERIHVNTSGTIELKHIQDVYKQAFRVAIPEHQTLVNVALSRFIVNGIVMRRLPLGEACDHLQVDVDLYCGPKDLIYKYVQTVEKAGLTVSDISFDAFALGKEASLFEKSLETYQLAIKVERQSTSLTLFAKGKLATSESLSLGSAQWIEALAEKLRLPIDIADRLIHNNIRLGLDSYPETPIYLWSTEGQTHTLSEGQVMDVIQAPLNHWLQKVQAAIQPILANASTHIVLIGESGEISGLDAWLVKNLDTDVSVHQPETLGVRSSALASVSGLFYVLKDQMAVRHYEPGVDMVSFSQSFNPKSEHPSEDTLSGRFKGLLQKR